ncbi:hypothetical protein [Methanococcus sp. CF]
MDSIEEIVKWSEEHGKDVGRRAREGCEISQRIIQFYDWYRKSADNCTFVLLDKAVQDYISKYLVKNG